MKKFTAALILAISLVTIPAVYFLNDEPALAAAKKKKKSAPKPDALTAELDAAAREFVKREKIPSSVLKAGEIWVLKSYTSQFKAVQGEGAAIYSQPDFRSKRIINLPNGAKLTAEAEFTGHNGGDWYYVYYGKAKGWVLSRFLVERDPDYDE